MPDVESLQAQLDERRYAPLRALAERKRRLGAANGRKPVVASLFTNLPPAPTDEAFARWQATRQGEQG